jgi:hypothetical protein
LARNFTHRPIQNLLPSKLPRTVNRIQIFHVSLTTNKKFVAFIIAADGKLGPKVSIFSTVQQTDGFFLVPNLTPRPVQNLLPSKLPRTGNSIQICSFLRILNPTILAFSLKFHLRGQIKILLPSK